MRGRRAEVRHELTGAHPLAERGDPAAAQLGTRASRREQAIEEHRQAELVREAVGDDERLGAGGAAARVVQEDDRRDVERADVRVQAVVTCEVDPGDRLAGAGEQGVADARRRPGEREDRAVMVRVGVRRVGQQPDPRRAREGRADRSERRRVASLRHVRDGEQRGVGGDVHGESRGGYYRRPRRGSSVG